MHQCDVCYKEVEKVQVYAVNGFPTSDAWCQVCEDIGAQPIWLCKFKHNVYLNLLDRKEEDKEVLEAYEWFGNQLVYWKDEYVVHKSIHHELTPR